jgi:hypothetical protein
MSDYYKKVWELAMHQDWSSAQLREFLKNNYGTHPNIVIKKIDNLLDKESNNGYGCKRN